MEQIRSGFRIEGNDFRDSFLLGPQQMQDDSLCCAGIRVHDNDSSL